MLTFRLFIERSEVKGKGGSLIEEELLKKTEILNQTAYYVQGRNQDAYTDVIKLYFYMHQKDL